MFPCKQVPEWNKINSRKQMHACSNIQESYVVICDSTVQVDVLYPVSSSIRLNRPPKNLNNRTKIVTRPDYLTFFARTARFIYQLLDITPPASESVTSQSCKIVKYVITLSFQTLYNYLVQLITYNQDKVTTALVRSQTLIIICMEYYLSKKP